MGKHPEHRMHDNSLLAWAEEIHKLSDRDRLVLIAVISNGPSTDRKVKELLEFGDMNDVRPTITRLVDAGVLYEYDHVVCPKTHRKVRRVSIARRPPKASEPTQPKLPLPGLL